MDSCRWPLCAEVHRRTLLASSVLPSSRGRCSWRPRSLCRAWANTCSGTTRLIRPSTRETCCIFTASPPGTAPTCSVTVTAARSVKTSAGNFACLRCRPAWRREECWSAGKRPSAAGSRSCSVASFPWACWRCGCDGTWGRGFPGICRRCCWPSARRTCSISATAATSPPGYCFRSWCG